MRIALAIALLLSIVLTDFASGMAYARLGEAAADVVRDSRTLLILALFLYALLREGVPRNLAVPLFAYACLVFLYALAGFGHQISAQIVIVSAQTLLIPPILFLVGSALVRTGGELTRLSHWTIGLCLATTLFGIWDIANTEFWTAGMRYGAFLRDVKGIVTGFNPISDLPWNFTGFGGVRRAAGLLAAPLAQGMFLAYGAVLALAVFGNRSYLVGGFLAALFLFGVYQSGTRGAILVALIAIPAFLYLSSHTYSQVARNLLFASLAFSFGILFFAPTLAYTLQLMDASSVGHLRALMTNLVEIEEVLIFGHGVGQSGAIASREGLEIAGGGEGALFTIIYQLGVPGAAAFLAFYYLAFRNIWRHSDGPSTAIADRIALAHCVFAVGFATTFVTSEHAVSLSGSGPIWLGLGAALSTLERRTQFRRTVSADAAPAGQAAAA